MNNTETFQNTIDTLSPVLIRLRDYLFPVQLGLSAFVALLEAVRAGEDGIPVRAMSGSAGTSAAATGIVDRLESLGFAQRRHSREDRRKVLVIATPFGRAFVDDAFMAIFADSSAPRSLGAVPAL